MVIGHLTVVWLQFAFIAAHRSVFTTRSSKTLNYSFKLTNPINCDYSFPVPLRTMSVGQIWNCLAKKVRALQFSLIVNKQSSESWNLLSIHLTCSLTLVLLWIKWCSAVLQTLTTSGFKAERSKFIGLLFRIYHLFIQPVCWVISKIQREIERKLKEDREWKFWMRRKEICQITAVWVFTSNSICLSLRLVLSVCLSKTQRHRTKEMK